jgi:predicted RNA-binding Zn-ribbon protein involved in translation (DUF1610 family)
VGTFRDLREIVKGLKHRNLTAKYCPCCGSAKLKMMGGAEFWLTSGKYVCLDCGYKGVVVMEKDEDSEKAEGES